MYVCLCKGITDDQIKDAIYGGATSLRDVRQQLGVMTQCGKCGVFTKQLLEETLSMASVPADDSLYFAAG